MPLSVSLLKLLSLFLTRHGELITREEIARTLWEDSNTVDIDTGINTAVRRLRAQLEDDPNTPTYIETVIGIGYRFIAKVEEIEEARYASNAALASEVPADVSAGRKPIQQPAALPLTDLEAAAFFPLDEPLAPGKKTSQESELPLQTGGRHLVPARFIAGSALLLFVLGAAIAGYRLVRHATSPVEVSHLSTSLRPSLDQITFNDEENRVTVEAVSPQGHLVAYSDRYGISVHTLDGGADHLLTSPSSFSVTRLSWHSNEDWLLVSGIGLANHKSEAWAVFMHGETPRLLLDDAGLAVVSPDGSHIAYTRAENSEIWLSDGSGQNAHLLVPKVDEESIACLLWSAQSDRLIVNRVSEASSGTSPANSASSDHASTPASINLRVRRCSHRKAACKQESVRIQFRLCAQGWTIFLSFKWRFYGAKIMMVKTDPSTGEFLSPPQPVNPALVRMQGVTRTFFRLPPVEAGSALF